MSSAATHFIWQSQPIGSPIRKLILLLIAEYADPSGFCQPNLAEIARVAEVSEQSVKVSISKLIGTGHLVRYADGTPTYLLVRPNGQEKIPAIAPPPRPLPVKKKKVVTPEMVEGFKVATHWWDEKNPKPIIPFEVVKKRVVSAVQAGYDMRVIEKALDLCWSWTVSGWERSLRDAATQIIPDVPTPQEEADQYEQNILKLREQ